MDSRRRGQRLPWITFSSTTFALSLLLRRQLLDQLGFWSVGSKEQVRLNIFHLHRRNSSPPRRACKYLPKLSLRIFHSSWTRLLLLRGRHTDALALLFRMYCGGQRKLVIMYLARLFPPSLNRFIYFSFFISFGSGDVLWFLFRSVHGSPQVHKCVCWDIQMHWTGTQCM